MKEDLLIRGGWHEGIIQGSLRFVALLIDKFATDVIGSGQMADRLGFGQRLNPDLLASFGA